ncbi:uracil-DNA glycosylase family protein [Dokdonia sp. Hel_I_53]|uniref:uracil-DNA glycosylase family protein n=1 Tax=Dokdonia sp. Hel_I_53 TaxID=1566287 RepID=UPI0011998AEB|nr:uracil-DNA glycosylase family protein [Dokdonia sp. Hel_I_53]TVZ51911.1 G/U mismatch-specific uracil-DNA glycosylase [Dokdonia sp. Hel_I_53]
MFHHTHPYPPFNLENATKIIVGTLPPPRFTTKEFKQGDVDFCYGSIDGQLWPILDKIFNLNLKFETTEEAIAQRKKFLVTRNLGICDIVGSAKRAKIDASDIGMQEVILRDILHYLEKFPNINTLLFTGGSSKNGPEYFFRKACKAAGIKLEVEDDTVPRIHSFELTGRVIKTVSLTAPSGAANRAVGSSPLYKELKRKNPDFNTIDFRVMQYKPFF